MRINPVSGSINSARKQGIEFIRTSPQLQIRIKTRLKFIRISDPTTSETHFERKQEPKFIGISNPTTSATQIERNQDLNLLGSSNPTTSRAYFGGCKRSQDLCHRLHKLLRENFTNPLLFARPSCLIVHCQDLCNRLHKLLRENYTNPFIFARPSRFAFNIFASEPYPGIFCTTAVLDGGGSQQQ